MRIFVIFMLVVGFAFFSPAQDTQVINEESVRVFLEVYPEFMALVEQYSQGGLEGDLSSGAQLQAGQIEDLLARFGMSLDDFSNLIQRISIGFTTAQMQGSDSSGMLNSLTSQMGGGLAPEEMKVIEKYLSEIERALIE